MRVFDGDTLSLPVHWALLVDEVRGDHEHGASWLARRAAEILATCAGEALAQIASSDQGQARLARENDSLDDLAALAWTLVWARPSMAAIANTITVIWWRSLSNISDISESTEHDTISQGIARLQVEAERQSERWESIATKLQRRIIPLLRAPIFTLSRSGSVERALKVAAQSHSEDTPLEVIIAESRPGSEGIELARSLATAGALVSVVTDSAIGVAMQRTRTLLLGADSVRSDSALVNKVGSYPAALVARDRGIPVYALCERLKITPPSYPLTLEKAPSGSGDEWAEVNWLFDVTPAGLITAIVTEDGALSPEEIARSGADAEAALNLLKEYVERARVRRTGIDPLR